MFERYTEKARRTIFFARYEASQFGSAYIETEHLLLGVLREDKVVASIVCAGRGTVDAIRKKVEAHTPVREMVSTSVDLPLSNESKRVLAYAAEEAERLDHKHIGTEHLLLGLLREELCYAASLLNEQGMTLETARAAIRQLPRGMMEAEAGFAGVRSGRQAEGTEGLPLHHLIEFRVGERIIGTAPYLQQAPRAGERIRIAQPLTPGKLDDYKVLDVTYEYRHPGEVPPSKAVHLAKVILQLQPLRPRVLHLDREKPASGDVE